MWAFLVSRTLQVLNTLHTTFLKIILANLTILTFLLNTTLTTLLTATQHLTPHHNPHHLPDYLSQYHPNHPRGLLITTLFTIYHLQPILILTSDKELKVKSKQFVMAES